MTEQRQLNTPLGMLEIVASAQGLTRVGFIDSDPLASEAIVATSQAPVLPRVEFLHTGNAPCVSAEMNTSFVLEQSILHSAQDSVQHAEQQSVLHSAQDSVQHAVQQSAQQSTSLATAHLEQACEQLSQYFQAERQDFTVPLAPQGTAFQLRVWQALRSIPFAHSCSYGQIAQWIGQPTAMRAVGAANRLNPIAIIVPCHRVIGVNQQLTGYAGGLARKHWLLEHERGR